MLLVYLLVWNQKYILSLYPLNFMILFLVLYFTAEIDLTTSCEPLFFCVIIIIFFVKLKVAILTSRYFSSLCPWTEGERGLDKPKGGPIYQLMKGWGKYMSFMTIKYRLLCTPRKWTDNDEKQKWRKGENVRKDSMERTIK